MASQQWTFHCKCSYAASQACCQSLSSRAQGVQGISTYIDDELQLLVMLFPDSVVLQRSKKLNILTTSKDIEAAGSQPSSTSYLIPALPHNDPAACSSERSQRPVPCSRHTTVSEPGKQASAAEVRSDPDGKIPVHQLQAASPPPLANGGASREDVFSNLPGAVQTGSGNPSNCMQGPSATEEAAETMPVPAAMPATGVSSHGYANQPTKPGDHSFRSCLDKQQWSCSPKQQGSLPSWPQDGSQRRTHHWEHASSQNFAQAKFTCTPSFSFSKQPCAVMW